MTKEITKANIIQEIQDKFKLRDLYPEVFAFSEIVVPVYDIGHHVKSWHIVLDRQAISANGTKFFHSVPNDEMRHVRRLTVIHETGANFDIDQIYHYTSGAVTDVNYIFYDTTSPITSGTVKIFEFPQDIPMGWNDTLAIHISNYVAGGYISVHAFFETETIR